MKGQLEARAKRARKPRDRRAAAYQGASEAVFAIIIATGLGYWADESFGTAPRYLLIGVVLGFVAFVLRLLRMRSLFDEPDAASDRGGPRGTKPPDPD